MSSLGIQGELVSSKGIPKVAVIGCGSHSFRNIFPTFQFIDLDLVATCDFILEKAKLYAKQFGASKYYTDYKEMIEKESLDGVFIILGYGDKGEPLYPEIVSDILSKGISVWMEKPPAANAELIEQMIAAEKKSNGAFIQVGFKKMFMPSSQKLKEIISNPDFGEITSYSMRYTVDLPDDSADLRVPASRRFIDDYVHVASMQQYLFGPAKEVMYFNNEDKSGFANFIYDSGLIGSVHFSRANSKLAPVERIEVVGSGENVTMNNNIEITYYKKGKIGPYGSTPSYIPQEGRVEYYSPEFSLGQVYNKGLFLLGYYNEILYFVDNLRKGTLPQRAGSEDALNVMRYIDSFTAGNGKLNSFGEVHERKGRGDIIKDILLCRNCKKSTMYLKDGWNYTCKNCGNTISADEVV